MNQDKTGTKLTSAALTPASMFHHTPEPSIAFAAPVHKKCQCSSNKTGSSTCQKIVFDWWDIGETKNILDNTVTQ